MAIYKSVLAGGVFVSALLVLSGVRAGDNPKKNNAKDIVATSSPGKTTDADKVQLINKHLAEKWKANQVTPSQRCNDYEFIRRASLDIVGRIATPKEIDQYLKDPEATRRPRLIDRLLKSDDYPKNWANLWTVWLMTRVGENDAAQAVYHEQMHSWLEKQFGKEGMSYKDMAYGLLTATGKTNENGAVNYFLAHLGEPIPRAEQSKEGKATMVPITSRTTRFV